jgi:uncharacterized protein
MSYDADVHHGWQTPADLHPYLPAVQRDRFATYGLGSRTLPWGSDRGVCGYREDALEDEVPMGSAVATPSVELTRTQLLEGCGVEWALLTGGQLHIASALPDIDYANALVRAHNDFSVERWLSTDKRFRLALALNARDPQGAVAEIARLGDHPAVVAVTLPGGAIMPFGQRFYRPIHDACAERDLVIAIHWGAEGEGVNPPPTGVGHPASYAEAALARVSVTQVHITSFLFEGVFERHPSLKLAILESGYAWVPAYMWYLDQSWKALRSQTPWLKRPPSESVLEHVRFATRPVDRPMLETAGDEILEWVQAKRTLMFSSDYPRWDWSDPGNAFQDAPPRLRERILAGNAREFFRA